MKKLASVQFTKPGWPRGGALVIFVDAENAMAPTIREWDTAAGGVIARAIDISGFTGQPSKTLDVLAPAGPEVDRIVVAGVGDIDVHDEGAWLKLGGVVCGKLQSLKVSRAQVQLVMPSGAPVTPEDAAAFAMGARLRSYEFDDYKTGANESRKGSKKKAAADRAKSIKLTVAVEDPKAARRAWDNALSVCDGVVLARQLVNEPSNVLGTEEFAKRASALSELGVKIEILTEKEMKKLGMRALLGVAQGSLSPPRIVIMTWNGADEKDKPVAFVGKGVVFDTGGISIKPAARMEDMKGDMAGAATVTGVMHALAARAAKVNAVGIIGLVENMPSGTAQRPGDIVAAMSGTTIEIINTDAEGRLVLADVLHYTRERFKPKFMIDLATLTGAIIVALGHIQAGLFSNDENLSAQLVAAGRATGEAVWPMPMSDEYDKLIHSKNADIKNSGGRSAGAVTAAQFLKRFVGNEPWAHLDVAGTAMGSPTNEISAGWASGFGVRLLDRLVRDNYEA